MDFKWDIYVNNYIDLRNAGINNERAALLHWNMYGIEEGRIADKVIKEIIRPYNAYLNKLEEFCSLYDVTITDTLLNPKIEFRYFCFRYLNFIRNISLPNITLNNKLEAVLIEYRCLPHLEFLIRNMILKCNNEWSHTIVCGNLNYNYMISICNNISPNIKVIKTDYDNLNQSTYSKLLASTYFWNLFIGEKILIYQEDSIIFKYNINDFIEYDYIGAPWNKWQNDTLGKVGNGGFSLRTKQCMIEVINKISIEDTIYNSWTETIMRNCAMTIAPEDVYFALNMERYNIGKIADWNTAFQFSSEYINNINSLGGHNFWISDKEWKNNLLGRIFNTLSISYSININEEFNIILNYAKHYIDNKNCIVYLFITEEYLKIRDTIIKILGLQYIDSFIIYKYYEYKNKNKSTYNINVY